MPEEEAEEVGEESIRSRAEKPGDVVISSQVGVKEEDDEKEPLIGDHVAGSCVLSLSPSLFCLWVWNVGACEMCTAVKKLSPSANRAGRRNSPNYGTFHDSGVSFYNCNSDSPSALSTPAAPPLHAHLTTTHSHQFTTTRTE